MSAKPCNPELKCEMCGISNNYFKEHYNYRQFGPCIYTRKIICVFCATKLQMQDKDFQKWKKEDKWLEERQAAE